MAAKKRTVYVEPDDSQREPIEGLGTPTGVVIPLPPELSLLIGGALEVFRDAGALTQRLLAVAERAQALAALAPRKSGRPRRR